MLIEPVSHQHRRLNIGSTKNKPQALVWTGTALAPEGLHHLPFRAGVEVGEMVSHSQGAIFRDADFETGHVKDQAGIAGMVAIDDIGVELDARVFARGDGNVGVALDESGGGNFSERGPRRQGN